jgi:hypothetical protein
MFAATICRDSDLANSGDKSYFQSIRTMHSGHPCAKAHGRIMCWSNGSRQCPRDPECLGQWLAGRGKYEVRMERSPMFYDWKLVNVPIYRQFFQCIENAADWSMAEFASHP